MWKAHLYQAERHVVRGEEHVTRQREMIAELERDGHDATEWRRFLTQLEELLALHVAHRDRLREELGASPSAPGRSSPICESASSLAGPLGSETERPARLGRCADEWR